LLKEAGNEEIVGFFIENHNSGVCWHSVNGVECEKLRCIVAEIGLS